MTRSESGPGFPPGEQSRNNRGGSRIVHAGLREVGKAMADGEALVRPFAVNGPTTAEGAGPITSLFDGLAPELRRFVIGVVRDPDLADDVMQATFLKALEHGHEARVETARGWLFRVAFHEALASKRRTLAR